MKKKDEINEKYNFADHPNNYKGKKMKADVKLVYSIFFFIHACLYMRFCKCTSYSFLFTFLGLFITKFVDMKFKSDKRTPICDCFVDIAENITQFGKVPFGPLYQIPLLQHDPLSQQMLFLQQVFLQQMSPQHDSLLQEISHFSTNLNSVTNHTFCLSLANRLQQISFPQQTSIPQQLFNKSHFSMKEFTSQKNPLL